METNISVAGTHLVIKVTKAGSQTFGNWIFNLLNILILDVQKFLVMPLAFYLCYLKFWVTEHH